MQSNQYRQAASPPRQVQWGITWTAPALMLGFYSLAIFVALGHHFFYKSLDGQGVHNQEWFVRAGTALAFLSKILSKTLLAASVGVASSQRIWRTLRSKFFSLGGIDDLFAASNNPINLFNLELWRGAKLAMLLILFIWVSPLITIISPGSLSVALRVSVENGQFTISNLNFSRDRTDLSADESLRAVNFVETSNQVFKDMSPGLGTPGYSRPSSRATALVYQTAYGGQIVSGKSPCGVNCTFTQSFIGPSYNCSRLDPLDPNTPWCKGENSACGGNFIFSNEKTDPFGISWYEASASNSSGDLSAAWLEGAVWVRYSYLPPEFRSNYNHSKPESWPPSSSFKVFAFHCEQWNTRFNIRRSYSESGQRIDTNYTFLDRIKYGPTMDFVGSPSQWASYAIHESLYDILQGSIRVTARGAPTNEAKLEGTKLVEETPFPVEYTIRKPRQNLMELVEQLHRNVTLSLLSMDDLLYLQPQSGTAAIRTSYTNIFHYNHRALLLTYGIAALVGLMAVLIGLRSLFDNGVSMKTGFLNVMTTTRNPMLDELSRGYCLGADPMPEELRKVRVRFGDVTRDVHRDDYGQQVAGKVMASGISTRHVSFGLEDEVRDIHYRAQYS